MSIYRKAVDNPVTTGLLFLAFAIFGVFSLINTSIAQFPDFDANIIMAMSYYQGASASDIENNLTKPLENSLNGVENLKNLTSQSKEKSGTILPSIFTCVVMVFSPMSSAFAVAWVSVAYSFPSFLGKLSSLISGIIFSWLRRLD